MRLQQIVLVRSVSDSDRENKMEMRTGRHIRQPCRRTEGGGFSPLCGSVHSSVCDDGVCALIYMWDEDNHFKQAAAFFLPYIEYEYVINKLHTY